MKRRFATLPFRSIRTRLLIAFVSILLVGFGGLTLVAGNQISAGAVSDYQRSLQNEVQLIARGIRPFIEGDNDDAALESALTQYEAQINGDLTLIHHESNSPLEGDPPGGRGGNDGGNNPPGPRGDVYGAPPYGGSSFPTELEAATMGQTILVERQNEMGETIFYTAAQVIERPRQPAVLLQLSVPASNLYTIIGQRWLQLLLLFGVITALALAAALWLSRSIIQPLYILRDSAARLAEGQLSYRVPYAEQDEIGEVAQSFNHMAKQVENMLEEQRAFASNTSHELRTPLTTVRLRTEALLDDATLDTATQRRYIEEIDGEVARLANLIQDLTLLSRFDAHRAELGDDQVDMTRLAASLQKQMGAQAGEKGITIALDAPPTLLPVHASLSHLTVAFRNLLDNAIKYTPNGGRVTWQIAQEGGRVVNTIGDTGRGIPSADLPRVFERFYRVDKARSRDVPGTGLGLALVKSIVDAYGGSISIASDGVDKGTTVRVTLPIGANGHQV